MDSWHVAAALLSAALHAGWNAAVKVQPHPAAVMTAQMLVGAVIAIPVLVWTGLPLSTSWPWIACSTLCNLFAVVALLRAYDLLGFGMAYPVVRALSVLLVMPLAATLSGERLSMAGLLGVAMVVTSLMALAADHVRSASVQRGALGWIAVAAIGTAAYVLCDAQGVRTAGTPLSYGMLAGTSNAIAMLAMQRVRLGRWSPSASHLAIAVPIGIASMVSYLLILWVLTLAPVAPSVALRDTSAVFAIAIAVFWLREPLTRFRLLAVALSAAAVPLLRLA
jgi:drug/metabolite transporter (DMT)-like permease